MSTPDAGGQDSDAPDTDAPDSDAPDSDTPNADTPDTSATDTPPSFLDVTHDASWSASLEAPRYATDREALVEHALAAIGQTRAGYHVNLVTHPDHGDPTAYLSDLIEDRYPHTDARVVDQCGCGGYVYRVTR